jgi:Ca2+-binding RTX toxin-like protein
VNRLQPGAVRRICGSAFLVAGMVVSAAFPRLAFATEPLGSVTIYQTTPANPSQAFGFTSDVPGMMSNFYLDQDPTTYAPLSVTSLSVTPGQYVVTQEPQDAWTVSDIECNDPGGNTIGDVSTRSATIRMDAGEEITCTFTDVPAVGDINIFQTTQPQDPTSFQYSGDIGSFGLADDGDESGADGTWRNFGTQGLTAGTYVETQSSLDGWNLTDISCDDPDGGTTVDVATRTVTFDLDAGETINCTFTDQPTTPPTPTTGALQFTVDSVPDNAVDMTFSGGVGSFILDDDGDPNNTYPNWKELSNVAAGSYTETVTVPSPFRVSNIVCDSPDAVPTTNNSTTGTIAIDLHPAASITCNVTVVRGPLPNQVNISLDTVPNDPVDVAFDFGSILKFTLDDDLDGTHTNGQEYNDMDLGSWPLTAHIPAGWRITTFTCSDPDNGSTVDKANARATIDLDDGETIRCALAIEPIPAPPPAPTCNGKVATIVGGAGASTIRGTAGNDVIVDLDGNNTIDAKGGNDTICTGPGNDVIDGGGGDDWVDAGGGTNRVDTGAGANTVYAGAGNDTITGGANNDKLYGGDGDNVVTGGNGNDLIVTGSGNDRIDAGKGTDTVRAGTGSNTVTNAEL